VQERATDVVRGREESGSWRQRKVVILIMAVAAMESGIVVPAVQRKRRQSLGFPLADRCPVPPTSGAGKVATEIRFVGMGATERASDGIRNYRHGSERERRWGWD
jgi:hypothetical protein